MVHLMRRAILFGALVAALALPSAAQAANPWEDLMGHKPRTWTDPGGRFFIDLPLGWTSRGDGSSPVVEFFKQANGAAARVTVTMKSVPPKVKARHFALHVEKDVKSSAKGYRVLQRNKVQLSGHTAIRTHFTYRELGNVQLINEVEQYVVIIGERAFVLSFAHAAGARQIFGEDFAFMVKGFGGRGPGEERRKTGKKRRKVRSGEMVNPNAVRY